MKTFALAFFFLFSAVAAGQTAPPPARESTPAVRQQTFEKVWEKVRDTFYDPNFKGVDWDKARERYAPLVAGVKTDAELYDVLNRMLRELKVSHMQVVTPETIRMLTSPPVATGVVLRSLDGLVVVTRVLPDTPAARAGVRPGFAVKRVDDAEVKSLNDANERLRGAAQTKVRVTFLDERDEERAITLERLPLNAAQLNSEKLGAMSLYSLFESRRLEGGVGYIRFSSFSTAIDKHIREAIESMRDAPGLVFDLRGNGGGEDAVAIRLASMLFDKPTQLMITRTRKGDDNYYRTHTVERPYLGPVVVLIDEKSGSASEQLTAGLQEAGRAYVVGKKTAGSDLDADIEKLPTGAYLIYASGEPRTPKGVVIEGRGVIPDLEVNLTRAGLLRGEDVQLDAALRYIRRKNDKGTH